MMIPRRFIFSYFFLYLILYRMCLLVCLCIYPVFVDSPVVAIACYIHIFNASLALLFYRSRSHTVARSRRYFSLFHHSKLRLIETSKQFILHTLSISCCYSVFFISLFLLFRSFTMAQAMPDYYSSLSAFCFCFIVVNLNASLYFKYTTRPIFIFHEGVLKAFRIKSALQLVARGVFRTFVIIIIMAVVVKLTAVFTWPHHRRRGKKYVFFNTNIVNENL